MSSRTVLLAVALGIVAQPTPPFASPMSCRGGIHVRHTYAFADELCQRAARRPPLPAS